MNRRSLRRQRGSSLLDAMISIVIFSFGILGVVRLQSSAVAHSSDAKYRADAAMFSDQVIALMWTAPPATLATDFTGSNGSGGTRYRQWQAQVAAQLPNGNGTITVAADGNVSVTVQWRLPAETSATPRSHVVASQIAR